MKRARSRSERRFYLIEWTVKPKHRVRLKAADGPNIKDIAEIVDRGGGDIVASREIELNYEVGIIQILIDFVEYRGIYDNCITVATIKEVESLPLTSKTRLRIAERLGAYSSILNTAFDDLALFIGQAELDPKTHLRNFEESDDTDTQKQTQRERDGEPLDDNAYNKEFFKRVLLRAVKPYLHTEDLTKAIKDIKRYWKPAKDEGVPNPGNFKKRARALVGVGQHILFFSPSYGVFFQLFGKDMIYILDESKTSIDTDEIYRSYKRIPAKKRQ